jgi:hypothetical protein
MKKEILLFSASLMVWMASVMYAQSPQFDGERASERLTLAQNQDAGMICLSVYAAQTGVDGTMCVDFTPTTNATQ